MCWTGFTHPESALATEEGVFVSDVGDFKVHDGVIWKISGGGKHKLVENLVDPKGLTVSKGNLFVADVDRIWKIETSGARAAASLVAGPGSFPEKPRFLNGMASDATGYLYVTDTFGGWVYLVSTTGRVTQLFKTDKPNGVDVASNGTVYVITFTHPGRIYAYDRSRYKAELIYSSEDISGGDGLVLDEDHGLLYASGYDSGKVVRINLSTGNAEVIAEGMTTPADIHLSLDGSKLLVPELESGQVTQIDLSR